MTATKRQVRQVKPASSPATPSGAPESCWVATAPEANLPKLTQTLDCEVAVVGGGIVGLSTALALCKQGKSPIVLEARQIGRQVTGRSTAKITTQHSLIYRHLIDHAGFDIARAYAEANRAGVGQIEAWMREHAIDCDYEPKAAYAYTLNAGRRDDLEQEREAAFAVGLDAYVVDRAPLPFETAGALRFPNQAQFNPAKYLVGLARAVQAAGGRVFEQSRVHKIEDGNRWRLETDEAAVDARNIVVATNMTVKSPDGYAHHTQPRSHPAIAFRLEDASAIEGMFIGIDEPTHSLRTGRDHEGALLIVLGPHFNTGQDGNVAQRFRDLEAWARKNLPVGPASGAGATRITIRRTACPTWASPRRSKRRAFTLRQGSTRGASATARPPVY